MPTVIATSTPAPSAPRRRHRGFEALLVTLALLVTGWFYYFTVQSTGLLQRGPVNFDYYNYLVDGFRSGHLYITVEPSPELKALPDPYDPARNSRVRLGDASYYRGHYYLYFGVTPAVVLMLPYTLLTGQHMAQAAAVLLFCLLGLAAASGLWLSVRARYFPGSSPWLAPLGIGVIGFGTHVLALARRPSVWELPIAAAFAFMMIALFAVFRALHGQRRKTWMAVAGLALALAVGARPPSLAAGLMLLVPLWWFVRQRDGGWFGPALAAAVPLWWFVRQRDGSWYGPALAAAVPLLVIGLGLAWYNYARFGSPVQFGETYQLTQLREGDAHRFSPAYIVHNLRAYFTWPVAWTSDWPFIASRPVPPGPSGYYSTEELYWLGALCPIVWLAPFALLAWRRRAAEPGLRAMVTSLGLALLPGWFLILCFFYAAERYMVDFLPIVVLLALCGALLLERTATERRWKPAFHWLFGIVATVTITMGLLASFDYHLRSMRDTDPATWKRLAAATEPPVHAVISFFHPPPKPAR